MNDVASRLAFSVAMSFSDNFGRKNPLKFRKGSDMDRFNDFMSTDLSCLQNFPKQIFESPTCGNGFLEGGEECDCGLPFVCENECCNPQACKLRSFAKCASGKCCNLETCQPRISGTECQPPAHKCAAPKYCDGENDFCPVDQSNIDVLPYRPAYDLECSDNSPIGSGRTKSEYINK